MNAIVYTSNTGFTAQYARLLAKRTGLPTYEWSVAKTQLAKGTSIVYLGWLFVGRVKGYRRAAKRFDVKAVCGVGLCDTGALRDEVRKAISLPRSVPLFTLQGGMDHEKLTGIYQRMIQTLIKILSSKPSRGEGEDRMLALLGQSGNYVSEDNLSEVLAWYGETANTRQNKGGAI